jgi:hypothetical protein
MKPRRHAGYFPGREIRRYRKPLANARHFASQTSRD